MSKTDSGSATLPAVSGLRYSMIIEWDARDATYVVTIPELPGCQSHGATYEQAVQQAQDAIETWIVGASEDGGNIPDPKLYE